ncbi:phage tail protein [Actinoplanes subtropicus]|uniref:phage tail protein n=1 Tax=Actinoplanes subtropicus TaxID=543632 RepID=UPI0004C2DFE1|nr:phage tail protein [Actinoplanes subtropicus]
MTFRLLDAHVGWDAAESTLAGLDDPAGVRLPRAGADPDGPDRASLLPWFPDRRLAPACSGGWYLATASGLLRRDGCGAGFAPVRSDPVEAVAASGHWVAAIRSDGRVHVWWREGEMLTGVVERAGAALLAVAPGGVILVAGEQGTVLRAYTPVGDAQRAWRTEIEGRLAGLRLGPDRTVWLLGEDDGQLRIWVAERIGARPVRATTAELAAALPPSDLVSAGTDGFCLGRPETLNADAGTDCFDWLGRPLDEPPTSSSGAYARTGRLATTALDSGVSRCRWHRIRIDADLPAGTTVQASVAVTEDDPPAESDWQQAPAGATDVLIDQPPGRYLQLRLALASDGAETPVVRRIRLDFPRRTSADLLPAAFRDDPLADDFAERFLSLFDSTLAEIDRVVERYPALLDGTNVPGELLPWLGGLLGIGFEAGWDADTRRALIAAAPALFRGRGTPAAVREAVRIVFGAEPVIDELAAERSWLRVGTDGALGAGRLFGRSRARVRLGSPLAGSPLNSLGDPYGDPLREHAYRLRVSLPARAGKAALERLVRSQTPAHTVAEVRDGGSGWVVGVRSVVGVDTAFEPLPAAVLGPVAGAEPLRLNRQSVLAGSRRGPCRAMTVGERAVVGVTSVAW